MSLRSGNWSGVVDDRCYLLFATPEIIMSTANFLLPSAASFLAFTCVSNVMQLSRTIDD